MSNFTNVKCLQSGFVKQTRVRIYLVLLITINSIVFYRKCLYLSSSFMYSRTFFILAHNNKIPYRIADWNKNTWNNSGTVNDSTDVANNVFLILFYRKSSIKLTEANCKRKVDKYKLIRQNAVGKCCALDPFSDWHSTFPYGKPLSTTCMMLASSTITNMIIPAVFRSAILNIQDQGTRERAEYW